MPQSVRKGWYVQRNAFQAFPTPTDGCQARFNNLPWVVCQAMFLGACRTAWSQSAEQWRDIQRVLSHSLAPRFSGLWWTLRKNKTVRRAGMGEWLLPHNHTCDTAGKSFLMPPWFTPHWGFVEILLLLVVTHLCVIQQIWTEIYCVPSILLDHGVGNGVW